MNIATDTLSGWRRSLAHRIESPRMQGALIALILVNAVILGLETSETIMARWGAELKFADRAILAVFVVEISLRLAVWRGAFFRDPWSVFDFIVVGIALIPATGPLAVLRALRVLRVLRLISMVPSMRRVAGGLLAAIPGLGSVIGIISVILYVFAVIATKLFSEQFPQWFGTLGESSYTLFQIMTLEGWGDIARSVMEVYPIAWLFFVIFILVSTFTMLNLFIAVVVTSMQGEHDREIGAESIDASHKQYLRHELAEIRSEMRTLRVLLQRHSGEMPLPDTL
ncbi:MAG: ion transporter [Burkholderiales bacterium]|nr:ion transporter [Burkholderiales bacterium]